MTNNATMLRNAGREKNPRSRLGRRTAFPVACVVIAAILLFLWYIGVFGGNVHTVDPGRVYRSAQITGRNLRDVLETRKIRTVINLRGGSNESAWHRSEMATCDRLGVRHVDVSLSAIRMPPPDQLERVISAFDNEPYPVLFHCQGGADRSGLVGTLYLNIYRDVPLDRAEKEQLTWRYGHMNFTRTRAMDRFFDLYRQTAGGLDMRDWIVQRYPALYAQLPADLKMPSDGQAPDEKPVRAHAASSPHGVVAAAPSAASH